MTCLSHKVSMLLEQCTARSDGQSSIKDKTKRVRAGLYNRNLKQTTCFNNTMQCVIENEAVQYSLSATKNSKGLKVWDWVHSILTDHHDV